MIANRQSGFSLVEVIVATSISAVVVLGTTVVFTDSARMETVQERHFWIAARRMEFHGLVRTQTGWNSIVTANPAMACFAAGTTCAAFATPQPLQFPIDGSVLDGSATSTGMTNKGDFCSTFDAAAGNSACPVGISLSWVANCDDVNCLHAQPKVIIKFQTREAGGSLQNLKSYDLIAFKDARLEALNEVCTSMGGVLVGMTCSIAALSTACDPSNALGAGASYPLGFNGAGAVVCGKPSPGTCAASDVATGFNALGGLLCAPACL